MYLQNDDEVMPVMLPKVKYKKKNQITLVEGGKKFKLLRKV